MEQKSSACAYQHKIFSYDNMSTKKHAKCKKATPPCGHRAIANAQTASARWMMIFCTSLVPS